jgi:hypothetical protein
MTTEVANRKSFIFHFSLFKRRVALWRFSDRSVLTGMFSPGRGSHALRCLVIMLDKSIDLSQLAKEKDIRGLQDLNLA